MFVEWSHELVKLQINVITFYQTLSMIEPVDVDGNDVIIDDIVGSVRQNVYDYWFLIVSYSVFELQKH